MTAICLTSHLSVFPQRLYLTCECIKCSSAALCLSVSSSVGFNEGWQRTLLKGLLILVLRQGLGRLQDGWPLDLPPTQGSRQINVSALSPWMRCSPLCSACSEHKPGTATEEIIHWLVRSGSKSAEEFPKVTVKWLSFPLKLYKTIKRRH